MRLNHCFWWAWAAVMWMGCEVAPKALSTRFIAGMWYLFTLIMVSSYTANLAASLTAENLSTPIASAEDLANQVHIHNDTHFSDTLSDYRSRSTMELKKVVQLPIFSRFDRTAVLLP